MQYIGLIAWVLFIGVCVYGNWWFLILLLFPIGVVLLVLILGSIGVLLDRVLTRLDKKRPDVFFWYLDPIRWLIQLYLAFVGKMAEQL